ncbi:DUF2325 domain-containing protein [Pseudoduganella lutea]|uniref:DUF2325 domain-containing protein n=1 Tax=Pseudoduganella lutea TaxID=321985 RepID=A0A4P6L110_9BURK|nr:DUF2325 domain-containing protein [Pseudoduganella lutea]QBE64987.1 DUF2325 domain-containing protein [Pseudoduganella lutea]
MCDKHATTPSQEAQTSRRRRIWELGHTCHCPLVGVSMPIGTLRKLVGKVTGGQVLADDYEIHVGAVSECGTRNRLSELLQKELERRYAQVIGRFRAARTTEAVGELWQAAVAGGDVAGAFWAGLTHPRCAPELEERMCRDLHMIQHQAGACARADINRFNAVVEENGQLTRELAKMQQRSAAMQLERNAEQERDALALMQLRAQLVSRDSTIDALRHELEGLRGTIPDLASRERLVQRLEQSDERERQLREQVAELRRELAQAQTQAQAPARDEEPAPPAPIEHVIRMPIRLTERSILCVGGRSGNVASYRTLIERAGAQFAHHDGGLEDNAGKLEASLAAADLVICQTGCISHSAYWRVKDFCKRTGKRCVFIDNPSISSLQRGLEELAP